MQRKNFSYAKYGYLFCIPFVLAFLVFSLYPLIYTVGISFSDMSGAMTVDREFGIQTKIVVDEDGEAVLDSDGNIVRELDLFGNYREVLGFQTFKRAFNVTLKLWIMNFIPQILLAIVLAAWFTSRWTKVKGQGLFKVLFYMPNIITAGSIAALFSALFMHPYGVVNDTLISLGILEEAKNWGMDTNATQYTVSFIQFWMWYGYTMLLVISGIIGLNPQMYEAADIDGAGPTKQFFYITLPSLRTILLYIFVTSLIGGLNMFDIPLMYSDGGPGGATRTVSIAIYQQAFSGARRYNMASAMSLIMFVVIGACSLVLFFIMRDKDAAKIKKMLKAERRAMKKAGGVH
ncbi:MAG: sugar ABC transporter permease [Oscillospiraceae bacterium]|nr:sugar ABC transporter permease [Oscillospiraceae bacterium]